MMAPKGLGVREKGAPDKEKTILEAAAQLFTRYGPKKTTIDDIATEAGIAKGTVYLYFKSKDQILETVIRREIEKLLATLAATAQSTATTEQKLKAFFRARLDHAEDLARRYEISEAVVRESRSLEILEKIQAEYLKAETQIIERILAAGIERQEISCRDIHEAAQVISLALLGLDQRWHGLSQEIPVDQRVDVFVELLLSGLRSHS